MFVLIVSKRLIVFLFSPVQLFKCINIIVIFQKRNNLLISELELMTLGHFYIRLPIQCIA